MSRLVFLAESSSSLIRVMDIALVGAGYQVLSAVDGREAKKRIDALHGRKINLLVVDAALKVVDGYTLAREVRRFAAYQRVPVLMLSSNPGEAGSEKGRAVGAKAWLLKPFNPVQFLSTVAKIALP